VKQPHLAFAQHQQRPFLFLKTNKGRKFKYDLKELEGKNICVTGLIKEYKGKPEVIVSDPTQIKTE